MGQNYFISLVSIKFLINVLHFFVFFLKNSLLWVTKGFYFFKTNTYPGYYWFLYSVKLRNSNVFKVKI